MHYGEIKYVDIANGEGVRTTLFVSGCTHHCKNCFQPETWNFEYGDEFTETVATKIIGSLASPFVDGLTLLGGEPMEPQNQPVLLKLVKAVKESYPNKTIWCYTGDLYEDLTNPESPRHTDSTDEFLQNIDILVDGPYVDELHDITLRFRGSSNQRIIDLNETRKTGELSLWVDAPEFSSHNWDFE